MANNYNDKNNNLEILFFQNHNIYIHFTLFSSIVL